MSAGPLGLPSSPTLSRVGLYRIGQNIVHTLDGDSSATASVSLYSPVDAQLQAMRSGGVSGVKSDCPNGPAQHYKLSGVQKVIIEELPDPKVRALNTLVPSAQSVEFVASNVPPGVSPKWIYFIRDTLGTPNGNPGYYYYNPCTARTPAHTRSV